MLFAAWKTLSHRLFWGDFHSYISNVNRKVKCGYSLSLSRPHFFLSLSLSLSLSLHSGRNLGTQKAGSGSSFLKEAKKNWSGPTRQSKRVGKIVNHKRQGTASNVGSSKVGLGFPTCGLREQRSHAIGCSTKTLMPHFHTLIKGWNTHHFVKHWVHGTLIKPITYGSSLIKQSHCLDRSPLMHQTLISPYKKCIQASPKSISFIFPWIVSCIHFQVFITFKLMV